MLDTLTDSDGHRTDYLYDPVGRLSGIWAANDDLISFVYDTGGRLTEKWFPNGVNTQYAWNADNSLAQVQNRAGYGDAFDISQHDYTYDGAGQRKSAQDTLGLYAPPVLNESYAYDPLGNRQSKNTGGTQLYYVVDAANQLKEIRQTNASGALLAAMVYDLNGNLTRKCEGSGVTIPDASTCTGSIVSSLSYNVLDQLVQVDKTGQASQTYAYDDQGRRIKKSVGGNVTQYLYNGMDIHGEYTTWSQASALYTHGPNTDDPIIRVAANDTRYYHQDGLGSVVATTDPDGHLTAAQLYDAWGNPYASAKLNTLPQYGYTGREPDETGLVYYRARYYDPSIGRFTQRDPIGLQGGINQYAYVNNNPVELTDPEGLTPASPVQSMANGSSYFSNAVNNISGTFAEARESVGQFLQSSIDAGRNESLGDTVSKFVQGIAGPEVAGLGLAIGSIRGISATGIIADSVPTVAELRTLQVEGMQVHHNLPQYLGKMLGYTTKEMESHPGTLVSQWSHTGAANPEALHKAIAAELPPMTSGQKATYTTDQIWNGMKNAYEGLGRSDLFKSIRSLIKPE